MHSIQKRDRLLTRMTDSVSRKIVRNTFYNMAGRIWVALTGLLLTPYIISIVGVERYGILALVGGITGYFGLFDFGVSTSFQKYIAEFNTRDEYGKINDVVNTGGVFYFFFGVIVFAVAVSLLKPFLSLLSIPKELHEEAAFVFIIGMGTYSASGALGAFASVPIGLQRMGITNLISVAVSIPNILGTVFALEMEYGLPGLMVVSLITALLSNTANMLAAFRILPELKFNPFLFRRGILQKLFAFGIKLQLSRLANLVSFQTDQFLITGFLRIGLVTYYHLGSSVVSQARQIPLLMISALIPAVAELDAREAMGAKIKLFLRGSKYLISFSTPVLALVAANAPLIMLAWMGQGHELASTVIRFLSIGYYLSTVTGVASSIAAGVARTDLDMKFGIVMAGLNLFLSVWLIIKLGFIGVLAGTTTALAISSIWYIRLFSRYLEVSTKSFWRLFTKPVAACLPPSIAVWAANYFLYPLAVEFGRLFSLLLLVLTVLLFFAIYAAIILRSSYFDKYDKAVLTAHVPLTKHMFSIYAN